MNRVRFENGTIGTVGVTEPVENVKTKDMNKLYIDIGAMSKEEAEQYVQPGDCAVFCGDYVELAGRNVMSSVRRPDCVLHSDRGSQTNPEQLP